jgi:3-deoxy-D-manno-octulosonic-acid transferase
MQNDLDAKRILSLGIEAEKVKVTGNLKFDHKIDESDSKFTSEFRDRYAVSAERPLIVAASTHSPEEEWILAAFDGLNVYGARLLIAPRHPDRFNAVADLMRRSQYSYSKRSETNSEADKNADLILLDSIGELRSIYSLAEIVFVGGSLIPHGGQSILEPAAAGKAIVTGPFTANFDAILKVFLADDAVVQIGEVSKDFRIPDLLYENLKLLLEDTQKRRSLGKNALAVMQANRGATLKTVENLKQMLIDIP